MSTTSLHRAIEDELVANPDDLATHAAYADLLSEEGDPRGEYIQLQIALDDPSLDDEQRRELSAREQELWSEHYHRWLGPMAPELLDEKNVTFSMHRGWLDSLHIRHLDLELARMLRDSPLTRLLRELSIEDAADESKARHDDQVPDEETYQKGFWPLVGSDCLKNVRVLRLGEDRGDDYDDYDCTLGTLAVLPLIRSMPDLEELSLDTNTFDLTDLFALPLKQLRVLKAYHAEQVHRLDVLARNSAFSHLTHLMFHPHHLAWWRNEKRDEQDGFRAAEGYLPLSMVKALLASPYLKHLTHLQLRVSSLGDEGCDALVESGVLGRLRYLDLRHGRISDTGALRLAQCPELRKLEWLDLRANSLGDVGLAAIERLGIPGRFDGQHDDTGAEPDAEDEYLTEGDFE